VDSTREPRLALFSRLEAQKTAYFFGWLGPLAAAGACNPAVNFSATRSTTGHNTIANTTAPIKINADRFVFGFAIRALIRT
jgi:hypothetical protein